MVWPPQDTGIFELKMPCCQCDMDCKSISGTNISSNCNVDKSVYPPAFNPSYPASPFSYSNPSVVQEWPSGTFVTFSVSVRFDWVDNCDGSTTVTVTSISVTSTDPTVASITNIRIAGGGVFAGYVSYPLVEGSTFDLFECGAADDGGLGVNIGWIWESTLTPGGVGGSQVVPSCAASIAGLGIDANGVAEIIESWISQLDSGTPYPFDPTPNCALGFVSQTFCPNTFSFKYFYSKFPVSGLTAGSEYCLQIVYEWQPLTGGAWSILSTVCVSFTATGPTELTDWIDVGPNTVLAASPGGANYRVQPGGVTAIPDPGGYICYSCS